MQDVDLILSLKFSTQAFLEAYMIRKGNNLTRIRGRISKIRTSQIRMRRRIWQRWNNPTGQSAPAFLIGCGRSGTSLIVYQLSKSWQTELYNEDNSAAFYKWRLRDLEIIENLIHQSYAKVVLFKPILDTYRINDLLTRFPDAKVLFAYRHFDDVINSSLKRFGITNRINHVDSWIQEDFREFAAALPPEATKAFIRSRWKPAMNPESGAALYWLFQNRLYFDLGLDRDERVKLISYEAVVSDPVNEFKSLCEFLGILYEPLIAEGVFSSSIKRDPPPYVDADIREDCEELRRRLTERESLKNIL